MPPPKCGWLAGTISQMPSSAAMPMVDSVDKSKLPLIRTKVWATTKIPRTEAADRMLEMFLSVRKYSLCVTKKMNTMARITQIR